MARMTLPPLTGLTTQEAARLKQKHGPNLLTPAARQPAAFTSLKRAATDPMAVLLVVASAVYVAIGDTGDAVITALALIPVTAVGLVLELRAARALEALRQRTEPVVTVLRDGAEARVPAEDLVPGDLVLVREGDVVPADGTVVAATQALVDESALTGESLPVPKGDDGEASQRTVLAGTTVLSGRATFLVTATGLDTQYGRIGSLVAAALEQETPLQQLITRLAKRMAAGAVGFSLVVGLVVLARGAGGGEAVVAAVSLALAAIPEEFPMVFTLYLSLGAWRLARRGALVRRLTSVETLGATSVICSDKTGTLTEGKLEVMGVATLGGEPTGGGALSPGERGLVAAAVLASEPDPFDPLEQAIGRYANGRGVDAAGLWRNALVHDHPFDPHRKYVSHVWQVDGRFVVAAKGSLEGMLDVCGADAGIRDAAEARHHALAGQGMRVIAVAVGDLASAEGGRQDHERALAFAGLLAFADPVRPGVLEALAECRAAGVRVMMITGDHPLTAHAVAEALGLPHPDDLPVVTGDQIDAAGDAQLAAYVANCTIFARTRPEQKHRIVAALQAQGQVVAMTGDGINDAPALRRADIGVAMGRHGTEVARAAAGMVLTDDNFATIVAAVHDGRRIFDNLGRAFAYLLAFHPPLLLAAFVLPLVGAPLLLLPVHLVFLELVVHPTVSLVFEGDPPVFGLMRRPPRPRSAGLITKGLVVQSLLQGLTLSAGVIALYLVAWQGGASDADARGLAFVTLVLGQTLLVLAVDPAGSLPLLQRLRRNRTLLPVVGLTLAVLAATIEVPALAALLKVAPLPAEGWLLAAVVAAVTTLWTLAVPRRGA